MSINIRSLALLLIMFALAESLDLRSPCEHIFHYEKDSEENRWNGVLLLNDAVDVKGIWVRILLNDSIDLLTSEFGLPRTKNNKDYIITNDDYNLPANVMAFMKFKVKYKSNETIPIVKKIRVNGQLICPKKNKHSMELN